MRERKSSPWQDCWSLKKQVYEEKRNNYKFHMCKMNNVARNISAWNSSFTFFLFWINKWRKDFFFGELSQFLFSQIIFFSSSSSSYWYSFLSLFLSLSATQLAKNMFFRNFSNGTHTVMVIILARSLEKISAFDLRFGCVFSYSETKNSRW